jgi:hypothetical protein
MRMWQRFGVAAVAVLTLGLAAAIPALVWTPPTVAAEHDAVLLPQELSSDLYEECTSDVVFTPPYFPVTVAELDGTIVVKMASIDEQTSELTYIEPMPEQAAALEQMNACFAQWPVEQPWNGPPRFEGASAHLYHDYLARVLTPCLRTQGLKVVELQVPLHTVDLLAWYFRQIETLDFEQSVEIWETCPLVPGYLEEGAYPERVEVGRVENFLF